MINQIGVCGGVIGSDFRGVIKVTPFNHSFKPYFVNIDDKIAQLILYEIDRPTFVETDDLTLTEIRFGSSGI